MGLLGNMLNWLGERRERQRQLRAAAKLDDPRLAREVIRFLTQHPERQEVCLDTAHGKALFTRKDVAGLRVVAKSASVGERVFAHAMMGGTAYGFPGGWSQDRIEQVMHLKHWVYIAQRRIWDRIARLTPNVGFVTAPASSGPHLKQFADYRFRKSLHAIKPHE